ncbi:branched-chain amino acid ABC transporter permease [Actinomadura viridis]|uniref:branched-chain amino acid ABC transporter permease n=1 Tax=Actinomadura viridis TaxID=58110 RepID=UPI0036795C6F
MAQLIWNGLFVGSFYALVAMGYSMIYGIIRLLNFAHGDLYMVGAFCGFAMLGTLGGAVPAGSLLALPLVLVLTMLVTGLSGVALERVAYRPLRHGPRLSLLITAVGASFALEYGVRIAAGPDPKVYPVRLDGEGMDVLGVRVTMQQIALLITAAGLMVLLNRYIMHSRQGRAMRAVALDHDACRLMGVDVDSVISRAFFIGSALAGAAGVMSGAYYGKIDFLMGFIIGLKAFTAAVIGGIGSMHGTMLGGLLLGLLESFGTGWLGGQWRDVFAFALLIAFLTLRPAGLLGKPETARV